MTPRLFAKMAAPLYRRLAMMLARAVIHGVKDDLKVQTLQLGILAGETKDDVERFQEYGLSTVPLPGHEALVVFVGGDRDHGIVAAVADRLTRKKGLSPGEVALYDHLGKFVHLRADGTLHIKAPRIEIEAEQDLRLYAGASYREDVHGYATQLEWVAGTTWRNRSWTVGATFDTPVVTNIEPPKVDDA